MTNENLYVDINVLQTVPSANINRDDTGAPKTAIYGGTTRARVSSQSWKRAVRLAFGDASKNNDWLKGYRTKRTATLLAKELMKKDDSLDFDKAKASDKDKEKSYETKVLMFFSAGQLEKFAEYILNHEKIDKKEADKILNNNPSLDLALFGRMVAVDPELNVDAASQVAHAISTHEIVPEFDFFTAVDDQKKDDESGSVILDTLEYNSSTLYRYANVNVNELIHNIGSTDLAITGLKEFIKDFALTMPTGHQNSYANKTIPQYIMVSVRNDTPVNLVSAFETPVRSREGYIKKSISKLEEEFENIKGWVNDPVATFVYANKNLETNEGEKTANIDDLIKKVSTTISERVENENSND